MHKSRNLVCISKYVGKLNRGPIVSQNSTRRQITRSNRKGITHFGKWKIHLFCFFYRAPLQFELRKKYLGIHV